MKKVFLYITVITAFLFNSCNRCDGLKGFRFAIPTSIYPAKDTFAVGDTIWIEQHFADKLPSIDNGKLYSIHNYDLKVDYSIIDLTTASPSTSYTSPFITTYHGNTIGKNIEYEFNNGFYHYKASPVLNKPGLYFISFGSGANGERFGSSGCIKAITLQFNTNNRGDNNYEFMKNGVDTVHYANMSKEEFDQWGSYCFYVR